MNATKPAVKSVVFVGAGNMAEALVKGVVAGGICPRKAVCVTDVRPERREYFEKQFGVRSLASNREAVRDADLVVLAVKPQVMGEVLKELRGSLQPKALVITIAAGIPTNRFEEGLGEGTRVIRVMPNTPALVQAGASALCGGRWVTETDWQTAEALMSAVGLVARVQEKDMDAVTAVSGSGPAYVFFLTEILLEAAERLHLEPGTARDLAVATVEGAARLMKETGLPPAELRARVTSKGGTTEAALNVLKEKGVFESFVEAVLAASRRAAELSKN
ncbi:MAG: pyrroline-5-carboxylate reductase [Verrucomicrobia bacterium]|nr:pyrroline-5-carboxylate reductase [Verrucomicrobiota bacterium]